MRCLCRFLPHGVLSQGRINRSEFIAGLIRFNIKLPADKETELWQLVDANGDGDISYQEFKVTQASKNRFVVMLTNSPAHRRASAPAQMNAAAFSKHMQSLVQLKQSA